MVSEFEPQVGLSEGSADLALDPLPRPLPVPPCLFSLSNKNKNGGITFAKEESITVTKLFFFFNTLWRVHEYGTFLKFRAYKPFILDTILKNTV